MSLKRNNTWLVWRGDKYFTDWLSVISDTKNNEASSFYIKFFNNWINRKE